MRRTKSIIGFTGFSQKRVPQSKGRPSGLSDPQLQIRRHQLVQIFESRWGDIGWELHKCKETDELIGVFKPIATPGSWLQDILIVFYRPSSESGSGATLRKLRAEQRALAEPIRAADELNRRAGKRLLQINELVKKGPECSPQIKQIQKRRLEESEKAAQECQILLDKARDLETRVRSVESSFARQELFRFLRSKRYSLTPVNLANAAAGLPHMGWRQSMRRCMAVPYKIADGSRYQIFKTIRYLTTSALNQTEYTLVTSFQNGIPNLPNRYQLPKAELAAKWLFLEHAVQQADRIKPDLKALPFEITKRYFKRADSATDEDRLLAEQAELTLSKQR